MLTRHASERPAVESRENSTAFFYLIAVFTILRGKWILTTRWETVASTPIAELKAAERAALAARSTWGWSRRVAEMARVSIGCRGGLDAFLQMHMRRLLAIQHFGDVHRHPASSTPHPIDTFDHPRYLTRCCEMLIERLVHVGPRAWLMLMLSFGLVFGAFDVFFWVSDPGSYTRGHNHQAYCEAEFNLYVRRFERVCHCSASEGATNCTSCVTGQCESECEESDYTASVYKNRALMKAFLVWSYLLMLFGQLLTTYITTHVFESLREAADSESTHRLFEVPSTDEVQSADGHSPVGEVGGRVEAPEGRARQHAPTDIQTASRVAAPGQGGAGTYRTALLASTSTSASMTAPSAPSASSWRRPTWPQRLSSLAALRLRQWLRKHGPRRDPYSELFMFSSPGLLIGLFQLQLLAMCAHVALCCMIFLWVLGEKGAALQNMPFYPLLLSPPLYFLLIYTPRVIERGTLLFSVGPWTERDSVLKCMPAGAQVC